MAEERTLLADLASSHASKPIMVIAGRNHIFSKMVTLGSPATCFGSYSMHRFEAGRREKKKTQIGIITNLHSIKETRFFPEFLLSVVQLNEIYTQSNKLCAKGEKSDKKRRWSRPRLNGFEP
jgi:hypothetical protein